MLLLREASAGEFEASQGVCGGINRRRKIKLMYMWLNVRGRRALAVEQYHRGLSLPAQGHAVVEDRPR